MCDRICRTFDLTCILGLLIDEMMEGRKGDGEKLQYNPPISPSIRILSGFSDTFARLRAGEHLCQVTGKFGDTEALTGSGVPLKSRRVPDVGSRLATQPSKDPALLAPKEPLVTPVT